MQYEGLVLPEIPIDDLPAPCIWTLLKISPHGS